MRYQYRPIGQHGYPFPPVNFTLEDMRRVVGGMSVGYGGSPYGAYVERVEGGWIVGRKVPIHPSTCRPVTLDEACEMVLRIGLAGAWIRREDS